MTIKTFEPTDGESSTYFQSWRNTQQDRKSGALLNIPNFNVTDQNIESII